MMMKFFEKNKKAISVFLLISIFNQIILPLAVSANNGGDINAEYSKGGGVGNDLVNMYNGAFNYKVDLMTLPGAGVSFPVNISYNSADVNMLSVPTCVGEGWSLNIPKITRQVKGVPDDFNGDKIKYEYDMKPSIAMSVDFTKRAKREFWGLPDLKTKPQKGDKGKLSTFTVGWDNYSGFNYTVGRSLKDYLDSRVFNKYAVGGDYIKVEVLYHSRYGISYRPSVQINNLTGSFNGKNLMDKWWEKVLHYGLNSGGLSMSGSVRQGFQGTTLSLGNFMNFSYGNSGTPLVDLPTITKSRSYDIKAVTKWTAGSFTSPRMTTKTNKKGGILPGWYKATRTVTKLQRNKEIKPAVGLLYDVNKGGHYVKDFIGNKTNLNKHMTHLPASQIGNDVFIQSGGYGGVFSVNVNDHKSFGNTYSESSSHNSTILAEFGLSSPAIPTKFDVEAGGGYLSSSTTKSSGEWAPIDSEIEALNQVSNGKRKLKASEVVVDDAENVYETWLEEQPVAPIIKKRGSWATDKRRFHLLDKYVTDDDDLYEKMKDNDESDVNVEKKDFKKHHDQKKLKYIEYLTTEEAFRYGYTRYNSKLYNYNAYLKNNLIKFNTRKKHISEIIVYERDQSQLIYGEPVYNIEKVDATFSYDSRDKATDSEHNNDPLAFNDYSAKSRKTLSAENVGQGILNKVTTPEYATTWLIKKIPSRDYEDILNDGVTRDDKGDCVSFDYFSPQTDRSEDYTNQTYRWRFPYDKEVDLIQGIKNCPRDNMASFSYGKKELKYVKSIETKTHHLEFIYDANYDDYYTNIDFQSQLRKDGYPVKSLVEGGIDNGSLGKYEKTWRLRELRLYVKTPDGQKEKNKENFLQKVVLTQNYSLCQNHPSNIDGEGKLTLTKVHSVYRQSLNGENYKYEFDYDAQNPNSNPDFERFNMDRWGNFQNNTSYIQNGNTYPYKEHPYTNQNGDEGINPAPWRLKKVKLPSGADMSIDFEKNNYAYSNSKIATEFLDILSTKEFNKTNQADLDKAGDRTVIAGSNKSNESSIINKNRLIVKLDPAVFDGATGLITCANLFKKTYLKGITHVKVKAYVKLKSNTNDEKHYGWVDVNAELNKEECKAYHSNGEYYGEIKLKKEAPHDIISLNLNPIRKAAFEKLKQQRTDIFQNDPEKSITFKDIIYLAERSDLIGGLAGKAISISRAKDHLGPSNEFILDRAAPAIRLNGWSKVALKTPLLRKKGAGFRVKTITLSDNWVNDATIKTLDDNYKYILDYDYNMYDKNGRNLGSSGVANEPINGNMENADFELSHYLDKKGFLFEGNVINTYGHPMDIHKGGPSIGYESVIVKTKFPSEGDFSVNENDVKLSIPPYQEYKFYSQREFPTIIRETNVARGKPYKFMVPIVGFVELNYHEEAYSQGYSIVTNDMAGKLKSLITKDRNGDDLNGQEYFYKTKENLQAAPYGEELMKFNQLDNEVLLINKDKKIEKGILGVSEKIWTYTHQNKSETKYNPAQADISAGVPVVLPLPGINWATAFLMPLVCLPVKHERDATKFAVTNKVIHKSGILEKVNTIKDESIIEAKYLGYDKLTGKVLLSSVDNEFGDPIYKFSRPAYWEYDDFNAVENSVDTEIYPPGYSGGFIGGFQPHLITKSDGILGYFSWSFSFTGFVAKSTPLNANTEHINDGDLLVLITNKLSPTGVGYRPTIYAHAEVSGTDIKLIDYENGNVIKNTGFKGLRVIKSGYNNLVDASLGEEVGQKIVVSSYNADGSLIGGSQNINGLANIPSQIVSTNGRYTKFEFDQNKMLNVSAVTFKENWPVPCCTDLESPYRNGEKNYWRPYQSFIYNGERNYSSTVNNRTRNSGTILNYEPFDWASTPTQTTPSPWILSSYATFFDKNGNLLEQKDALKLNSSSGYGYGANLVKFVSGNSRQNESGFESFEDYEFYRCSFDDGFSFFYSIDQIGDGTVKQAIDETQSHSGKSSLILHSKESIKFEASIENCEE